MEKGDTIFTYLNKLTTCRDELGSVGIIAIDDDMEEIKRSTQDGSSSKNDDEEILVFASKARKGKGKASHFKLNSSHGGKKGDMSKVRCFNCHEMRRYVTKFEEVQEGILRRIESGASFHMIGDKKLFSALEDKDLKMHIEMGDNERYSVLGVGMVAFQREHGAPLTLTYVMYVLGLKKNLVSVVLLEEKGYDVIFSK
eukprot:PITA_21784